MKVMRQINLTNLNDQIEQRVIWFCPGCNCHHQVPVSGSRPWTFNGNMEKPTLDPSVLCNYSGHDRQAVCHCYVRSGEIQFLADCTHELAGKTVVMKEMKESE